VRLEERRRGRVRGERRIIADWFFAIALGAGVITVGTISGLVAVTLRKHPCPACSKRALRCVATRSMWSSGGGHIERMYRCSACNAEFMRRGNNALVPKADWDRGSRGELPEARLHRD
jgi:putative component of membrane protein insertase Oxa1/YidC/SpoIIIJ protein YidD